MSSVHPAVIVLVASMATVCRKVALVSASILSRSVNRILGTGEGLCGVAALSAKTSIESPQLFLADGTSIRKSTGVCGLFQDSQKNHCILVAARRFVNCRRGGTSLHFARVNIDRRTVGG